MRLLKWIAVAGLALAVSAQADGLNSCPAGSRVARRIVSHLDLVEFRLPFTASMVKASDVDYVEYRFRYGPRKRAVWLRFMRGLMVGGSSPANIADTSINWVAKKSICGNGADISDWRGLGTDGRQWRHVAYAFGFADYRGVDAKAADYFDKILDTMCCGSGVPQKH